MAIVYGVLLVSLDQFILLIVDLLPKAKGRFVRVHIFDVFCPPSVLSSYLDPISPASIRQGNPLRELALIL